ncbi:hypothetical protein LSS_13309 [Leptospira santarosai serovar Shermani str. LT 821]|uniref:Uncharacterized protein n=1 Tax=Leptospira santarosai serovar Shermani str. LT 821 TaxID=758847 RepID=K8XYB5_9LEPT|nr:hypothetical protein LSS_13309 [Leptospira santarosai serovar Shermani str. LT 821]
MESINFRDSNISYTNSKYFLRWFSERTETRIFDF